MSREIIHRLWKMVIVLLLQLIILNHVHVLTYATPVIIAYVTMNFQRGASRVGLLLWGFVTGLLYDVFSNTMGLGMCSATLLAMMQPLLLSHAVQLAAHAHGDGYWWIDSVCHCGFCTNSFTPQKLIKTDYFKIKGDSLWATKAFLKIGNM